MQLLGWNADVAHDQLVFQDRGDLFAETPQGVAEELAETRLDLLDEFGDV